MKPHYSDDQVTLYHGDCIDVLAKLPDASVHAVVTDPPYLLGFMGREWDTKSAHEHLDFHAAWAAECLRVLKPGGHLLAFGGTRTYHRLTCAIEDVGFEIRDGMNWLYGSGFPKSLDVSKAIDKRGGNDGGWFATWLSEARATAGMSRDELSKHFPSKTGGKTGKVWNWEHGHGVCTQVEFDLLCNILGQERRDVFEVEGTFIAHRRGRHGRFGPDDTRGNGPRRDLAAPGTNSARQWNGWGTALKPAHEPIAVARKPLSGTVAANVLEHGTGALNIDGCRVTHANASDLAASMAKNPGRADVVTSGVYGKDRPQQSVNTAGRWPTNVILTHSPDCAVECTPGCPVAELDAQSGTLKARGNITRTKRSADRNRTAYGAFAGGESEAVDPGDTGTASRFFPVFRFEAKASTSERPRANGAAHPTVKPVALMRWLVRLVTPPGGTVLDPFLGSGTTADASRMEGFHCIGIERDADYLDLIEQRLIQGVLPFGDAA